MSDDPRDGSALLKMLDEFLEVYPNASAMDVMAEFDLSHQEVLDLLAALKQEIEEGWNLA